MINPSEGHGGADRDAARSTTHLPGSAPRVGSPENSWRQTVRDLYDDLHHGKDNMFTGNRLAKRLIAFIEDRHPGFFNEPRT